MESSSSPQGRTPPSPLSIGNRDHDGERPEAYGLYKREHPQQRREDAKDVTGRV